MCIREQAVGPVLVPMCWYPQPFMRALLTVREQPLSCKTRA